MISVCAKNVRIWLVRIVTKHILVDTPAEVSSGKNSVYPVWMPTASDNPMKKQRLLAYPITLIFTLRILTKTSFAQFVGSVGLDQNLVLGFPAGMYSMSNASSKLWKTDGPHLELSLPSWIVLRANRKCNWIIAYPFVKSLQKSSKSKEWLSKKLFRGLKWKTSTEILD